MFTNPPVQDVCCIAHIPAMLSVKSKPLEPGHEGIDARCPQDLSSFHRNGWVLCRLVGVPVVPYHLNLGCSKRVVGLNFHITWLSIKTGQSIRGCEVPFP